MYRRLRTYARRLIHAFSTRSRVAATLLFLVLSGWLVSEFVLAQKEMNVYIFPSAVTSDGWNDDIQSLSQDLSPDATLADFTTSNSAFVSFGLSNVIPVATSSAPEALTPTESVPGASLDNLLPITPSVVPLALPENTNDAPIVVPAVGEATTSSVISLPNPFVPVTPLPESITASSAQSLNLLPGVLTEFFGVKQVLAQESASTTIVANDSETTTPQVMVEEGTASGTLPIEPEPYVPTPMSADPYSVASCTTLGLTCHLMTFVGFGLGDAFLSHPLTGATLELSVAGRSELSARQHDRLLVRVYHAGRWEFLGETEIKGELSNAKRGGYLSYDLPEIADWKDLSDMKVVVEYAREGEGNASLLIDGVWVNAKYGTDSIAPDATPEEIALTQSNVRSSLFAKDAEDRKARRDILDTPEGTEIALTHADVRDDADIIIKTDKEIYRTLGNTSAYFNVTNQSTKEQVVRLQFHFPEGGGGVSSLSRLSRSVPYKVGNLKYDSVGYFCASGWEHASSTDTKGFTCVDTNEVRSCDSLNDDKTNCIVSGARVGLTEDIEYRDGWVPSALVQGSFRDDAGIFAKAIDIILGKLPSGAIPPSEQPVSYIENSVLLLPGQTAYLRADLALPLNGRGDFYIEGATESGAYGLVHAAWDGSWNYRVPVDIDNEKVETEDSYAVPVSLDSLPLAFWDRVNADGSDVRFVDETGTLELPYWLSSWKYEDRKAFAWVRIPKTSNSTTTRIYVYYGDHSAASRSSLTAPFRTDRPTSRAVIAGSSQHDMTLLAIALDEDTHVQAGEHEAVTLKKGETALFGSLAPGDVVQADGPISLSLESSGSGATVVPYGYAGGNFVIPGIGGERILSMTAVEDGEVHTELKRGSATSTTLDPIAGTIVSDAVDLGGSIRVDAASDVIALLSAGDDTRLTPLYPSTDEPLYGFMLGKTVVGFGTDGSTMKAVCAGGAVKSADGRREGMMTVLDHCQSSVLPPLADAVRISELANPASVLSLGGEMFTSFIPKSEFASSYVLAEDAGTLAFICAPEDETIDIGVFDASGAFTASTTCEARGARPGKALIESANGFHAGSVVRSLDATSTVFMAAYQALGRSLASGETAPLTALYGAPQLRSHAPNHPRVTIGEEEFVIPGEHRKLDLDEEGKERVHVDKLLTTKREFSVHEQPGFQFQYTPQSNSVVQGVRGAFGVAQFSVTKVALRHAQIGEQEVEYDIGYGDDNIWSLSLKNIDGHLRPGKYTLHVEIEEGGSTYVDEYDFYWGVLAINYNKSVFTPGETANISIGALSDNGNTICDATLKLWVTPPGSTESELPVAASGLCDGNNVVDVPDYASSYTFSAENATGTYKVKLVRFDREGNIASQVTDTILVRDTVPLSIEREGPTRIYPVAHYPMKIRVAANEDFKGNIVERLPGDFVIIDRGSAELAWGDSEHTFMTATWLVDMKKGAVVTFTYEFDAPDRSPYLYELGPASTDGDVVFSEARKWQIASDAAGKMMIYWDRTYTPSGWTCISCLPSDVFYNRFAMGSSTYGGFGGAATHTPTASAAVSSYGGTGVGPNTTNNTNNAPLGHTHTLTPQISGVSNLPTYRQLAVLQSNSAGDPATIPGGAIVMFDIASSSLPSGWYRYTPLDGRYVRGQSTSTVGTTGGANTHSHTATGTLSVAIGSGLREQNGTLNGATDVNHTHTLSATNTDVLSNEPPYVEVLFAQQPATSTPVNYMLTMWENTPPSGWTALSDPGGPLEGKFLKASTTYGLTGGSNTHAHADIFGATTSVQSLLNNYTANASNAQAPAAHTHSVDITGFSTDDHRPPYVEVIFAKRLSGVTLWTQQQYRWYANANVITPTDAWPPLGGELDEDSAIDSGSLAVRVGDVLRLRVSLLAGNSTSTVGTQAFKLQYAESIDCPSALNWFDVAPISSTTAKWRGYNNGAVADRATLPSTVLTLSNVAESYTEENNSTSTSVEIGVGQVGEWDWVLQSNIPTAGTNYCFRMVKSDGTPLDTHTVYPEALTNFAPNATVPNSPFDNEKVSTTTPYLVFASVDPEVDDLDYEVQVSATSDFAATIIDVDSTVNPELFDNVPNPTNKAPFNSGDQIRYRASPALTNGSTYWWRVRAKDLSGSNAWSSWSTGRSFTVDTTVTISTWFQTTRDQFETDGQTNVDATSTVANDVMLIAGQTSGVLYSPQIDLDQATLGTAWGTLSWNDSEVVGDIKYHVQYLDATSTWVDIPDSGLSGNSAGFDTSPISLLSVDPNVYTSIRLAANFTSVGGSPRLFDWTLSWGYKVTTPVISTPFDNAKVSTTTPSFDFISTDPNGDPLTYEISWSTDAAFSASTTRTSDFNLGFQNLTTPSDTDPYTSGENIRFTVRASDALTNGTTYYYRVRAKDPTGGNDWSFWSDTRSLTVDTSITVATWFQSMTGQFDTDTLTSMYNYGLGSSTVSTSTTEAMISYGEGTVQTPRYRIWGGTAWGSELSALTINSSVQWVVLKASPVIGEYMMGTLGSDRDINFQIYNNGIWGNMNELTTNAPSVTRRSLDIAYETISGRALAVACDGDADPSYAVWDGTNWGSTQTIDLASTNNCEWIRLASNPVTNEIILLERNTGNLYQAAVWNATSSTWGTTTNMGSMAEIAHEGMALEYEESGDTALAITSNTTNSSFVYKAYKAGAWSASTTVTLGDDFEWGTLVRDRGTDRMALCYVDEDGDIGMKRWDGGGWVATTTVVELETAPTLTENEGRPVDCSFENTPGRDTYIMTSYSDLVGTRYRTWDNTSWVAEANIMPVIRNFTTQLRRTDDNKILSVWFDYLNGDYYTSSWNGTTWSATTTIETSASVTATPYGEPFMVAPKRPATRGTIISSPIDYDDGASPAWDQVLWSKTTPGLSTFKVQIEYYDTASSSWKLVPDTDLSGNSSGTSTSPISIRNLDTTTYNQIRLVGNATCVLGNCPVLNDWTVKWSAGLNISGTAKQQDLATNVTSGTVAVAVNGVLQAGKTGTISAGTWTIPNVTFFPGSTLTVFVSGAATSARAVAVAVYDGPGDFGGMSLNEHWLTVGSASGTLATTTLTNLSKYDNSVAGGTDVFYDVTAGGDYNHCAIAVPAGCYDSSLYLLAGNIFSPSTSTAKTLSTYDMRIAGSMYLDANTLKVGASWRNLGGFTPNTGTVMFNATTSTRTIDNTGAATSTFGNVTFGEIATPATWTFSTPFVATGTVAMNFGTTSPGAQSMTLLGDLTIGASGTFAKGSATTTFSGTQSKTWTDSSAAKQDLGNVAISGTAKTITLGSSVKATNINIVAGNTLNAGGANTFSVLGFWDNAGTFTPQTGTVAFIATSTSKTINQASSNFYNATFNGVGGAWRWLNTNATTTNDLTIATGTLTLPGGTFEVGGSFANTGGTFVNNSGITKLTSTAGGKTIQTGTSTFNDLVFSGSGGTWSFVDVNATTSGTLTILAGTPTFPSGVLEVGNNFINTGGTFAANGGTLKLTSSLNSRTITFGGSSPANLTVQNAGVFTVTDTNATTTGNVNFVAGTTTLPTVNFVVGGSFTNTGRFTAGANLVTFNAASGAKTINPGASSFASVLFSGAGTFTVSASATTTNDLTIFSVGGFTQSSGTTLAVGGQFTNQVGGATTTWSGSTLALNSGTAYSINTKTAGGDLYGALRLAANTQIRSWNSSSTVYVLGTSASLYSQNHNGVSGEVDIFGTYTRTSGSDYWSYATDFDGAVLGSPRQANVRFDNGATASFGAGTALEILGSATASTSVDRKSSGNYGITLASSTINAQYYQFRNMNASGLTLNSSTTVTSLANGDFSIDLNGASGMTVASSTIDTNPGLQLFYVRFATSTGISAGFNVAETGAATSFWRFKNHYGNYAGEAYDSDPGPSSGNPGYVRWDDSNFVISISGTVYSDAGSTPMAAPTCDGVTNTVRVKVSGQGNYAAPCTNGSGAYTVSGVTFIGDNVMTVYLDTNGGAQAVTITKSASANLTGIDLYQHRVILRHEDTFPMSIADMKAYDRTGDTDIPFIAATSSIPYTLTTDPDTQLWVWNSKTFIPGGNITLNSGGSGQTYDGSLVLSANSVFTAQGTETHSIGGGLSANAGAVFTAANSTFNFTATTTGKSIIGVAPLTFWRMSFSGSGGGWVINQAVTVNENFLPNAGTVSGTSNVTVSGTTVSGAGSIAMTGGTFTLSNGGTFGGSSDWSFSNLTFGNGTLATTTKTGSSTVTVSGVLTDAANQTFEAGTSTTWVLTGGGTPLVLSGTFTVQNATFRYAGTSATNVTPATYAQLDFGANGVSSPVYTLLSGTFNVGGTWNVGVAATNTVTVNANTNDPTLTLSGNMNVVASSTFVLSNTGSLTARRNWTNLGTTTASGGTVTFDATTTGFTISPGASPFANVSFNNSNGGWTVVGNATATGNFTLSALASFTLSPNATLEVNGVFTNGIGGAATTWTNSTLYLNSSAVETINTKTTGADTYGTLIAGGTTQVRVWNSSAATTTTNNSSSVYSMNHANVSGALNIWGTYNHSSGTDYWDYATDFDGVSIASTSRVVNVRVASSSSLNFSGGQLEVLGASGATTTIDVLTTGGYSWNITGGILNMQYYKIRGVDQNGLSISGTPTVSGLSNGDFLLAVNGATMMTIAGGTIDANPLKTFFGMSFATSSGITSGYNITATGVSGTVWTVSGLSGNYAGEARDNDPGGDPGYIRWDDSAAQISVSGNVYSDEGLTPIGGPVCDGVTQNVRLKVQGVGSYTSACNAGTGAFSISNIIYNPRDTLTLYLASTTGVRAVNIAYDPATNITNMNLYQNRVILRHEQGSAVGIAQMATYDNNKDSAIPFTATTTVATSTTVFAGTGLVVWNSKVFAPGGNVTLHANASGNSWDGSVHLLATSTWSSSGTESYSVGGSFAADTSASVAPANSTFNFTATTTGKSVTASNTLTFHNLTFSGAGGAWNIPGVSTTSNDLTISGGTLTLPEGTLFVGGSWNNSGGAFVASGGTVEFTATASGKNIRTGTSAFWNTTFSGTGGAWTYLDTNSTTSGTTTVTAGTLTLPSGVYAEGKSFDVRSGSVSANGGTLKMISTSTGQTIRLSGSSLANLSVAATGTFQFLDSYATTTGDISFSFGTTTFPYAALTIGGSFSNSAVFSAGTSTLVMNGSVAGKTISLGNSSPYNMTINGASGGFTVSGNATTSNNFSLAAASTYTQSSGTTLAVGGVFTNSVGGAPTTWTGTTLSLYGTSSNYSINTKSAGGDAYNIIRLAANTNIRMWNSSVSTTQLDPASSIYSQNNAASAGSLYIYGNYTRNSGTDYWSYATDFDGTALGGSSRQANVRFDANATATFQNGATLSMQGSASASTSVDRITSGNYGISLDSSWWTAQYYQFRNMNSIGLNLIGTTTISMNNGDFSLDVNGGSSITVSSTTIDQNASQQFFYVKFATSSGITSGYNVLRTGTTTNSFTFNSEYGNFAGEAFDNDGPDGCGSIRWSDSACLISDQRGYRWRNDDGAEGAPSSEWYNQSWTKRERIRIVNNATTSYTNEQVKLDIPYDSDMKSNFDDIRFTDSSGTTSIPFWTESYLTSATATVWVKVPSLPGSGTADIFMYFGNSGASYAGSGTSTFTFFDDFEDGNLSEYTGNTTLFSNDATFNYERTYGLAASAGNTGAQNTSGIGQASAGVGRDTTFRFNQYIDMATGGSDEPCFLFAIQPPITGHQNYGVCLSPFGADHLVVAKNVSWNGRAASDGSTLLVSKAVTYTTGWYQVSIDWIATNNQINVNVYDNTGSLFATATTTDSTWTSGGVGFTFWGMHGGWDIPFARTYNYLTPSYSLFTKQADSGASWAATENTYLPNYAQNQNVRLRFSVRNSSLAPLSENFRLQYAAKLASPNCESVPTGNYSDVPTTSGGCGSAAACMTTSSQFAKSSSTQLLTFPNGYTFTQSQILEDPNNQTDNISLLANAFTEVEYNIQMTNNSSLDRYCFRTTNAGTPLDNYTRVAEIQVLHPPALSNFSFNQNSDIALTEGTTTSIMATATVTDLNGYSDIVAASSTYFRSSVAGDRNCSADSNNCYQIATSSCALSNCAGNSCTISCAAPMYYFADPTDVGSTFASDVWSAIVDIWDTANAHSNSSSNQELYTLKALTSSSTINYGSITVGTDTGASDATTTVSNTGNTVLNLLLSGSNMTAGSSTITVDKQKYATSTFVYSSCTLCNSLATSSNPFNIGIVKPTTTTTPFSGNLYWGLAVPNGTAATTHSGVNTFLAN